MDTTQEAAPPPSPWSPFLPRLTGLLTAPAATLREAAQRGDWIPAALMILVGLLVYVAPIAYQTGINQSHLMDAMASQARQPRTPQPAEMTSFYRFFGAGIGAFTAAASIPNVLVMGAGSWFARTGLLYFFGRVFMKGRDRSFLALLTTVGWAWLPLFLQSVLVGLTFAAYPPAAHFFIPLPTGREAMQAGGMVQLLNASRWNWVLLFATPFVWWNWYLCTLAVETSLQLPRWRAALTVTLQVAVHAAYAVAAYFASSAWFRLMESFSGASPR